MELMCVRILLLLLCFANSQFSSDARLFVQDPEAEWKRLETEINEERSEAPDSKLGRSASNTLQPLPVPKYMVVTASKVHKELFEPEKNTRPLPASIRKMLLGAKAPTTTVAPPTRQPLIEVLCQIDRMYVRIRKNVFKSLDAHKYVKLGKCPVNHGTKNHYYFLYLLNIDCGYLRENNIDNIIIRNSLTYKPPGPALREMPFDITLQCKYPRFFHSFKAGFYPMIGGGTVYKELQPKHIFSLTPQDATGTEMTDAKSYTLGQLMFFEAKMTDAITGSSGDQRIYVNKCFMTPSRDSTSNPRYVIIDNYGCMIDGKVTPQSQFLTSGSKMIQRFRVAAFIFHTGSSSPVSSTQQLYMHCELAIGSVTPSQGSKACNYDVATQKWKELYGDDSVCTCCETSCQSAQPKASRNIVSSHSWNVDVGPQISTYDVDALYSEDSDQEGFLNYWGLEDQTVNY